MKLELDLNELLGFEYDSDGEPIGKKDFRGEVAQIAANVLLQELRAGIVKDVREKVSEIIESEVRVTVARAMEGPIQKTSPWGEKQGQPVTILEMIRTSLEAFLS